MLLRVSDGGWMDGWHRPEDPHLSPPNPWHSSPLVLYSTGGTLKSGVSQNSTWSPDWKIGEKGETKIPPKKGVLGLAPNLPHKLVLEGFGTQVHRIISLVRIAGRVTYPLLPPSLSLPLRACNSM